MSPHFGLQRTMIPGAQVSALTTGNIALKGATGRAYASYILGGTSDKTEQLLYKTEVITTLAAVLSESTDFAGGHSNNNVAGYVAGGANTTASKKFNYSTLATSVTAVLPASLARSSYIFANSGVAGYIFGGDQTAIFKMAYPAETHSTISATFPRASNQRMGAGSNNGVAGYMYGGTDGANSPTFGSTAIQKLTFSTDVRTTLAATISAGKRTGGAAADSGTATYLFGGYDSVSGGYVTTDKILFSTEASSVVGGNMASTFLSTSPGVSSNNGVAAYIAGGEDIGGSGFPAQVGKYVYATALHTVISATTWGGATAKQGKTGVADCERN